jgi:hypothetical protein
VFCPGSSSLLVSVGDDKQVRVCVGGGHRRCCRERVRCLCAVLRCAVPWHSVCVHPHHTGTTPHPTAAAAATRRHAVAASPQVCFWDTSAGASPVAAIAAAHGAGPDVHCVDWSGLQDHLVVTGGCARVCVCVCACVCVCCARLCLQLGL